MGPLKIGTSQSLRDKPRDELGRHVPSPSMNARRPDEILKSPYMLTAVTLGHVGILAYFPGGNALRQLL